MRSKDTKITFFAFLPYECAAAEEYLELMAEKGWFQSIKGNFFKFKKTERKKIKYSVNVLHKVSIFDNKDSDVALEYREYCKTAGWNYICQVGKIQIFYTENDNKTISIHNDEDEKIKSVYKASLYNARDQIFLTLIFIFNLYTQLFVGDAGFALTSNLGIFSIVAMSSIILTNIIGVINFFLWVIKAKSHVKKNKFMNYNNYKQIRLKNIFKRAYGLLLLLIFLKLLILDNLSGRKFNIYLLITLCIPVIIMIYAQKFIKKKRYSKNINRAIIIGSTLVLTYLVIMLVVSSVLLSTPETSQNKVPNEKVSLTLMDFGIKENNDENPYVTVDKSIIAQRIDYSNSNGDNQLTYTIFESKYPLVIKFYEKSLLSKLNSYSIDLKQEKTNLQGNIKVYSDRVKRSFVLISKDKVVDIKKDFSGISDEEFKNKIYKKLFYK